MAVIIHRIAINFCGRTVDSNSAVSVSRFNSNGGSRRGVNMYIGKKMPSYFSQPAVTSLCVRSLLFLQVISQSVCHASWLQVFLNDFLFVPKKETRWLWSDKYTGEIIIYILLSFYISYILRIVHIDNFRMSCFNCCRILIRSVTMHKNKKIKSKWKLRLTAGFKNNLFIFICLWILRFKVIFNI